MAKFKNVADAAAALAEDPKVKERVESEIIMNRVVTSLLQMRLSKGMTQEDIAKAINCDPSKISRMEAGNDMSLRWQDIVGYLCALNVDLCMTFEDPNMPAAQRIKQRVLRIHKDLEVLAKLAKQIGENDDISKKIHQFYGEVLFNFLIKFKRSYDSLPEGLKVTPKGTFPVLSEVSDALDQNTDEHSPVGA
jgi:transcriptional regulator with XRE-family HTH domain